MSWLVVGDTEHEGPHAVSHDPINPGRTGSTKFVQRTTYLPRPLRQIAMTNTHSTESPSAPVLGAYPTFELEYYLDDNELPKKVIICGTESTGQIATEWLAMDLNHAIPIEETL